MKRVLTACFVWMVFVTGLAAAEKTVLPRNVLLLIGDGMGAEEIKAARLYAGIKPASLVSGIGVMQ